MKPLIYLFCFTLSINAQIKVDLKTPLLEKLDLSAVEYGFSQFLNDSDVFSLQEFGEDYSIVFSDYDSIISGNVVTISLQVVLRTTSDLREGRKLGSIFADYSYSLDDPVPSEVHDQYIHFISTTIVRDEQWLYESFNAYLFAEKFLPGFISSCLE